MRGTLTVKGFTGFCELLDESGWLAVRILAQQNGQGDAAWNQDRGPETGRRPLSAR